MTLLTLAQRGSINALRPPALVLLRSATLRASVSQTAGEPLPRFWPSVRRRCGQNWHSVEWGHPQIVGGGLRDV